MVKYRIRHCCAASLLLLAFSTAVYSGELPASLAPVAELGRLNGIALACKQPALTARLRQAMVDHAPKSREVGEAFEQATNRSFLSQGQSGSACPEGKQLAERVDFEIAALRSALSSGQ